MKRLWLLALPLLLLLTACTKEKMPLPPVDESPWLNQDRAFVTASSFGCDYFVVQTAQGYSLMRSWSGAAPFEGSVLYGDFTSWGIRTFYNRSGGYLLRAEVRQYWLSYFEAMSEMNYRCNGQWP